MTDKQRLTALANDVAPLLDGTTEPIKAIIAENDVVFGVWQDASESDGVGIHVIKGQTRLSAIASGHVAKDLKVGAIPCACQEQAIACQETLGEKVWGS